MADKPRRSIRDVAEQVRNSTPGPRRQSKSNRTIPFSEPQFSQFQSYYRTRGIHTGAVLDQLIEVFLAEIADDLPPNLSPDE